MTVTTTASAHAVELARRAIVRMPRRTRTALDAAFAAYARVLDRELRRPPLELPVLEVRRLAPAAASAHSTWMIALDAPAEIEPGDMLYVAPRNAPAAVERALARVPDAARGSSVSAAMPSGAYRPPRRERLPVHEALSRVVALDDPDAFDAADSRACQRAIERMPRLQPKIYTLSAVADPVHGRRRVELLVSLREPAGRVSGYLAALEPDAVVRANRLPHPHRLPALRGDHAPTIAVVTGSAIAGVLAALRAGRVRDPLWLVWGVRDRAHAYHLDEIEAWVSSGAIARFDLAESRHPDAASARRAPDVLRAAGGEVTEWIASGASLYVSGHDALGSAARAAFADALTLAGHDADVLDVLRADLRYIDST